MSSGINNIGAQGFGQVGGGTTSRVGGGSSTSFADVLKGQIDEVVKLQQDASKAVEDLTLGKSDDVTGVMAAMEKSDIAFKTLLAIRGKLMEAYDEVKNIQI